MISEVTKELKKTVEILGGYNGEPVIGSPVLQELKKINTLLEGGGGTGVIDADTLDGKDQSEFLDKSEGGEITGTFIIPSNTNIKGVGAPDAPTSTILMKSSDNTVLGYVGQSGNFNTAIRSEKGNVLLNVATTGFRPLFQDPTGVYDIYHEGNLSKNDFVGKSIQIPDGADLNSYKTEGFFNNPTSSNFIENVPKVGTAFALLVEKTTGNGCKQTWTNHSTNVIPEIYVRTSHNDVLSNWERIATETDVASVFKITNDLINEITTLKSEVNELKIKFGE